jgi:hypothetical protein
MTCECGYQYQLVESKSGGLNKWMCEKCGRTKITNDKGKEYLTSDVPNPKRRYLTEG